MLLCNEIHHAGTATAAITGTVTERAKSATLFILWRDFLEALAYAGITMAKSVAGEANSIVLRRNGFRQVPANLEQDLKSVGGQGVSNLLGHNGFQISEIAEARLKSPRSFHSKT